MARVCVWNSSAGRSVTVTMRLLRGASVPVEVPAHVVRGFVEHRWVAINLGAIVIDAQPVRRQLPAEETQLHVITNVVGVP